MRRKSLLTLALVQLAAAISLAVTTAILYHETRTMLAEPELKKLAGTMSGYADAMLAYREIFTTISQTAPQYLKTTQELEKFFLTLHPVSDALYDLSHRGFTLLGRQFWPLSALQEPAAQLNNMLPDIAATCAVTAETLSRYDDHTHQQTLAAIDATIDSLLTASGTLEQHAAKRDAIPLLLAVTGWLIAIATGAGSLSHIAALLRQPPDH
ncbi:MAG TPA: hypothetical protein PLT23_00020 [Lentisphaeria bacterium]|nr:hypothetical protein [Lentisphaerota bacterium]OQC14300.1 MAG: hypothetical protein BWX73_01868 [Lentisphaerae bacterium ADurb.Bin082]HPY89079.1 hypothetical protein [Lentisphaeria bacterium]HQL87138.1 hypothetical protein [Lentisphaeria bacterium]